MPLLKAPKIPFHDFANWDEENHLWSQYPIFSQFYCLLIVGAMERSMVMYCYSYVDISAVQFVPCLQGSFNGLVVLCTTVNGQTQRRI